MGKHPFRFRKGWTRATHNKPPRRITQATFEAISRVQARLIRVSVCRRFLVVWFIAYKMIGLSKVISSHLDLLFTFIDH
jgi:hypothetical protein